MPLIEPPITIKELDTFIGAVWKTRKCECCDNDNWSFGLKREHQIIGLSFLDESEKFETSKLASIYVLLCESCGNVRLINPNFIQGWVLKELRKVET